MARFLIERWGSPIRLRGWLSITEVLLIAMAALTALFIVGWATQDGQLLVGSFAAIGVCALLLVLRLMLDAPSESPARPERLASVEARLDRLSQATLALARQPPPEVDIDRALAELERQLA